MFDYNIASSEMYFLEQNLSFYCYDVEVSDFL